MSYEIVYNRAFIKTTRGIIPLLLTGSNNCYEYTYRGRERRERDWACFWGNKHIEINEQDLLTFIADKADEKYEFCMFRGKWVYYKDAYDFYKQGIKNAHSLEDWLKYGAYGKYGSKMGYLRCYISDWRGGYDNHFITLKKNITTTGDLEAWLDEATAYIKGNDDKCFICLKYPVNEPITYNEPKVIKGNCIIAYKHSKGVYVADEHTLTHNKNEAMIFENEQQAKDFCEKQQYRAFNYKIIKYAPIKNTQKYVISLGQGAYFYRKTRYGMRYIYSKKDAQKMEKKKAQSMLERLTQSFKDRGYNFTMEDI